jgi:hypothetical protein
MIGQECFISVHNFIVIGIAEVDNICLIVVFKNCAHYFQTVHIISDTGEDGGVFGVFVAALPGKLEIVE